MTDLYRGLDAADIDGMVRNAARIKAAGLSFTLVYLKYAKPEHISALHGAGLAVGLIFEAGTQNALGGAAQGSVDGVKARAQASALDVPADVPIFATVDTGVGANAAVVEYLAAFRAEAVYADGAVLRSAQPRHRWLAGAMGWPGSRDYYASGLWTICQGTPMRGGHQLGLDWPDLGVEYDPDVARNLDWAWMPGSGAKIIAGLKEAVEMAKAGQSDSLRAPDPTNTRAAIKTLQNLLNAGGYECGPADGIAGPRTRAALQAFEMGQR